MILNCLAVDDEPLALGLVNKFIQQTPFLHLVGKYASAIDALKVIHAEKIDLIFLDIQLPELSGLELARIQNQRAEKPRIIFTTAYNQFAIEGYKVDALDYLLKPFNYEEFLAAAQKSLNYYSSVPQPQTFPEPSHLFLKVEHRLVRIDLDEILFIQGLKDFVKVELQNGKSFMSLTSLKALEEKLPFSRFMRVHRSYIIALDKISSMTKRSVQVGKQTIAVGDQYSDDFAKFIGRWS